jgi:hypothetical protein
MKERGAVMSVTLQVPEFATHAALMKGPLNVDLDVQPLPDLAIEVVVSHAADNAMRVWGRLRVPEVWTYDPIAEELGFWLLRDDGAYVQAETDQWIPDTKTDAVRVISVHRGEFEKVVRAELPDGSGDLEISLEHYVGHMRWLPFGFRNVPDVRRVEQIVRKNLITNERAEKRSEQQELT